METPFLVSVLCEPDLASLRASCAQSAIEGAEFGEVNLAQLNEEEFEKLCHDNCAFALPFYVACRKRGFMSVYGYDPSALPQLADGERVRRELLVLERAIGMDIEWEAFETKPTCRDALVAQVHERGKLAIVSFHSGQALSPDDTESIARKIRGCGADAVKIINRHSDPAYIPQIWEAIRRLRGWMDVPFVLLSMGPGSSLLRHVAVQAGCSYTFGRTSDAKYFYSGHPPLMTLKTLRELMPSGEVNS